MKKIILIAFISLFGYSFAQNYQPFLDTNKMWIEYSDYSTFNDADSYSKIESFRLFKENDTLFSVKSNLLTHIYWVGFEDANIPNSPLYKWEGVSPLSAPLAYLIERDSIVYIYNSNLSSREILYDFRETINDTTELNFYVGGPREVILDSTGIFVLNDLSLSKELFYHTTQEACFIQCQEMFWEDNVEDLVFSLNNRFGSVNSLLIPFGYCYVGESWSSNCLECYFENGVPLYGDSTYCANCKERIDNGVTQNVLESSFLDISIYPNPTSSTLNISGEIKFQSYKIVDIQGKVLDSGQINNGSLDVSKLKQGLYYLIIETEKGMVSKKFTKI